MTKKIGIVGAGAIAQAYRQALAEADFASIVAVCDSNLDAATSFAEATGARPHGCHREMLGDGELDGVIVATPPATHPAIAIDLLEAGIPVLCEKPLAIDPESARTILAAAARTGTLVTMASKFRYVDDIVRLRDIVNSGELGEIMLVENAFASPVDMSGRWNSRCEVSGGGVLIDNGTHSVDVIRYLLGPIEDVLAITQTCAPGLAVDDNALLMAYTASGVLARVDLSWSFDKQLANFVSVYGKAGTAHVGWRGSKWKRHGESAWTEFGPGYDKVAAFQAKVRNFCDAIDGRAAAVVTPADAMASVDVIHAAYRSAQCGEWVSVETDSAVVAPPLPAAMIEAAQ